MFVFIAATGLAYAAPLSSPGSWLSDADYPAGSRRRYEEGPVDFSLLISPQGRVSSCTVVGSSGSAELDGLTCALATPRFKFRPAKDEQGNPAYSIWQGRITWMHPNGTKLPLSKRGPPPASPADIELQVTRLPEGAQQMSVSVIARIGTDGHIAACQPSKTNVELVKIAEVACTHAKALLTDMPMYKDGNVISYVRGLKVVFRAGSPNK